MSGRTEQRGKGIRMVGKLEPLFCWKSNSKSRLYFQGCEPTILQNSRSVSSGIGGEQVYGYNSGTIEDRRHEKCHVSKERRNTVISIAKDIRIFQWATSKCHVISEWCLSPGHKRFHVFRIYHFGEARNDVLSCPVPDADRVIGFDR